VPVARALAKQFTPNLIYFYEQSGRHGADFWEEEMTALRGSTVVVIFWSANYLRKNGTIREMALVLELLQAGRLGHPLILRLDETSLNASANLPGNVADGEVILAPLAERWRALPAPVDIAMAASVLEQLLISNASRVPPEFDRSELLQLLTASSTLDVRHVRPIAWIAGHDGLGRRFLVERFMRTFDPNSRRIEVAVYDSDGPLQLLLRVRSAGLGSSETELRTLAAEAPDQYGGTRQIELLTKALEEITAAGRHVVARMEPTHFDASGWIPAWILDWFATLGSSQRPLIFIVAQFAFPTALLRSVTFSTKVASVHVASLSFEDSTTYASRLTSFFDKEPNRWSIADIESIADASEGRIALLIAIAKERCQLPDLRSAPATTIADEHVFAEKVNSYLNTCAEYLRATPDALELLLFLIDLVLVSYDDLRVLFPKADLPTVLSKCIELGIVECPSDGLYQVPRLVQRRLYSRVSSKSNATTESLARPDRMLRLAKQQPQGGADPYQGIESRIRSALLVSTDFESKDYSLFLSAGYLLHAAIRTYDRQQYQQSLLLLRLCVRRMEHIPELNTRCVMLRYYGLAAARQSEEADMLKAVQLLRDISPLDKHRNLRANPKADAEFVLGFSDRLSERWDEAIRHYLACLRRLDNDGAGRVSDCHRELAECFLHTRPIDFSSARFHAESAYAARDNFMSLDICVKVLIASCWNDDSLSLEQKAELEARLDQLFERLEASSSALGTGVSHQRKAEDLAESNEYEDLVQAVAHARKSLEIAKRDDFQPLLWKLLMRLGTAEALNEVVEATKIVSEGHRANRRTSSVAARYLVAAYIATGDHGRARDTLNRYRRTFPRAVEAKLAAAVKAKALDLSALNLSA
jgi:tetratricopeptide (TPR) repeat protein